MDLVPERIRLPLPISPAPSPRIPIVAALAPVVVSVGLFAVTGSPLTLVFAVLGPVTAVASLVDGLIGARRHTRRERRRFEAERVAALEAITVAHRAEVELLAAATPSGATIAMSDPRVSLRWRSPPVSPALTIGDGVTRSQTSVDGGGSVELAPLVATAARLRSAPILVDAADGIGIVGALPMARAVARGLVIQALALHGPDRVTIAADGPAWGRAIASLPHRRREIRTTADSVLRLEAIPGIGPSAGIGVGHGGVVRVEVAEQALDLAATCATIVTIGDANGTGSGDDEGRAGADVGMDAALGASMRRAGVAGERLVTVRPVDAAAFEHWCAAAAALPLDGADTASPPDRVALAGLLPSRPPGVAAAAIGVGVGGVITIDLEREGPHAVVGGTTGSGKSELLLTWIASMAWDSSPEELAVLLIDFKGGAGFAPLAALPHVVGIVTDLDEAGAMRAVGSLRAELRRREAGIAAAGLREHRAGIGLPRLVIVVDEYAALVDLDPALHAVFADLAARGRSLGIHLIVGTQRPSASVRDAVLANADVRVCLRVRDRADAVALVGAGGPAELPAEPRGRAVISAAGAPGALVQIATVDAATIDRIAMRWAGAPRPSRPWRDPLPAIVTAAELPGLLEPDQRLEADDPRGAVIGVIDRPDRQRIEAWRWHPRRDGMMLAVGASGCGRTGLVDAIVASGPSVVVPPDAALAWDAVHRLAEVDGDHGGLTLVIDDLDLVIDRFEPEHRQAWVDRLVALCRRRRELGIGIVVTAASVDGAIRSLEPHAAVRVLMRMPSRQDHRMAGGDAESWDPRLPPGGAVVDGRRAQVLQVATGRPQTTPPQARAIGDGPIGVIAADPGSLLQGLTDAGRTVLSVAEGLAAIDSLPPSAAIVGDVASWQARWDAVEIAATRAQLLLHGVTVATLRAVTGRRELPPPLPDGARWCWLLMPGRVVRARLP